LIRLDPVKSETGRQSTAEFAQSPHQLLRCGSPLDLERTRPCDVNVDSVAFLQPQRLDHGSRNANRQAASPFRHSHGFSEIHHRGSVVVPIKYLSTACAHWRPSRIAQTTSDWPRRMSPAANTFGLELW